MTELQETIKRVAEEGLEAKNLVNWISDGSLDVSKAASKPPTSPRPQSISPKPQTADGRKDLDLLKTKRRGVLSRPKSRLRSASAGRNPEKDLRARYWTFLFENLHRAVDEIYQTCEMDESIVESKEAIMMLENYSKDFHALIQYINISKNYEKTAPIDRPTSLAWEVRKSSPGKSLLKNVFIEKLTANSQAKKILCFDSAGESDTLSDAEVISLKPELNNKKLLNGESNSEVTSIEKENLIKKDCNVTISVVSETNENFLSNKNLIVNEICCLSDKILADKPSTIVEAESESANLDEEANGLLPYENSKVESVCVSDENKILESVIFNDHTCEKHTSPQENAQNSKADIIEGEKVSSSEVPDEKCDLPKSVNDEKPATFIPEPNPEPSTVAEEKKVPLKRKVLVKKNAKVYNEKVISTSNNSKQSVSNTEKNNLKNDVKDNKSLSSSFKSLEKEKILKPSAKENEISVLKKDSDSGAKNDVITSAKKVAAKCSVEKTSNASFVKPTSAKPVPVIRKVSPKVNKVQPEEKKPVRNYSKVSAIQRNISYVSSLSSKNQLEKAAGEVRKKPLRTVSHAMKMTQKSGSMSSLHKISISHRWSDKASSVEQIPEIIKTNTDEDSDGWETVRGRNRCRNSPAKKISFSTEKNDKALDMAKLNQTRFGGFPYTTKTNTKVVPNKPTSKKDITNKEKNVRNENSYSTQKSPLPSAIKTNSASKKSNNNFGKAHEVTVFPETKIKHSEDLTKKKINKDELICKNDTVNQKLMEELRLSDEVAQKIKSCLFKSNHITKSASVPCLNEYYKNTFCFSNTKSLSDQFLNVKKYKLKHFTRNSVEKTLNSARKKNRKCSSKSQDSTSVDAALNTSLDESDNGLTSDDQDGQTSHDEAYDAQCQDLCDTAWKYKILEQQVHKLELSWGEQMDRYDMELRTPGRALEMHEKLSSPFRKKSLMESIRLQEEKQVKAREQRERLLEEKLQKIKEIEKKRQEMKAFMEQRQEKQRVLMEQKLQRAEEKRKKQLQMIIRKAHDEEEKVNEIAFINTLEAQNKRHDLISKEKDHEARLHDIQEERQRKQEEKAAKEAAAEERRKLLEAERQARLNEMQEKRKMRDHKVEQLFLVKEKERQELASQKARDREQRLSALSAQQQNTIEELQKKIQLKQEESARRHEENMEQIRQKAFELSVRRCSSNNDDVPQPVPYETKKICTMCNVLIGSEVYLLSHLRGKKHQEMVKDQYQGKDPSAEELELYNLKHIVDASTDQLDPNIALDKERQKALKKRCKKLRQRMSNRGLEYESELEKSVDSINSNVKSKMMKIIADIKKFINVYEKSSNENSLLSALERCLNEIDNVLEKKLHQDKVAFRMVGGIAAVVDIFKLVSCLPIEKNAFLHKKIINHLSNIAESVVEKCHENCLYILFSNKIGFLLDLLIQRLNILIPNNYNQMIIHPSKSSGLNIQVDIIAGKLMHFLSSILSALSLKQMQLHQNIAENNNQKENLSNEFQFRVQDVLSYIVSIGIVDKLSQYFNSIQGPVGNEAEVASFILNCIAFLTSLIKLYSDCFTSTSSSKTDDTTQLIAAIKVTNMIGSVSLLYGLLLHSGVSSRGETPPPQLPKQIEILAFSTLCMLNHMAVMNLQAFQTVLGSEGLSLQLRHITSHLLWYCNHWTTDELLHEVILLVGYFTVLNVDNQSLIQAGQRPTVLQQLCSLPFLYFSDSELTDILFPTLIACCFNNSSNKTILEQEMSSELLSNYIEVKYLNHEHYSLKPKTAIHEKRWLFSTRFPKNCWSTAKHYFSVK